MSNRRNDSLEPHSSCAKHAISDDVREAYQLWWVGYTDDAPWVCVDDNCRVPMTPCCWKWSYQQGCYMTKAGDPAKLSPYFRAEREHDKECRASFLSPSNSNMPSEYRLGMPTDYPARVKLSREASESDRVKSVEPDGSLPQDPNQRRPRSIYGIREACEYYADHQDQHWRPLRVDGCPGASYEECFIRLGTGGHQKVGRNWIFFDQLWCRDFVGLRSGTETFDLPLLTTVREKPRRLLVHTSNWLPSYREGLRKRLLAAIRAAKEAPRNSPERPWVFFYGRESTLNQVDFEVDLQPGVDVLMKPLPRDWDLRPWNYYRPKRKLLTGEPQSVQPDLELKGNDEEAQIQEETILLDDSALVLDCLTSTNKSAKTKAEDSPSALPLMHTSKTPEAENDAQTARLLNPPSVIDAVEVDSDAVIPEPAAARKNGEAAAAQARTKRTLLDKIRGVFSNFRR